MTTKDDKGLQDVSTDFIKKYIETEIAKIDRRVKPSSYGLVRGEMFEVLVSDVLGLCGIASAPYGQKFPDNGNKANQDTCDILDILKSKNPNFGGSKAFIKGYQRDLWVAGGTTGYRYPVEGKERRHPYGKSIFSYRDVLVGKVENWDIKNALAASKRGYRGVLAIVVVDGRTGDIRVTPSDLESQQSWLKVTKGHEVSYAVPTDLFMTLEDFVKLLKAM